MIKTKRHLFRFYFSVGFLFIFLLLLGLFMLKINYDLPVEEKSDVKSLIMFLISIGIVAFSFHAIRVYYRNCPIIKIDHQNISFGKESHQLSDIKKIKFSRKVPFKFGYNHYMEGSKIHFIDGTKKLIYDDMYSNTWQLKQILDNFFNQKNGYNESLVRLKRSEQNQTLVCKTFKGPLIINLRALAAWGLVIFFIFLMLNGIKSHSIIAWTVVLTLALSWLFLNSFLFHAFRLNNKQLIVYNQHQFWKKHVYEFEHIKEVVIESGYRMPIFLRVVTKDFRKTIYSASTLTDKTWLKLKKELKKHNIKVRDEV